MPNKWTDVEDRELRRLVSCFEKETTVNWVEIARRLPGRNNKDCRKRWTKISEQWRKGSWDEQENARLRQAVAQHGTKWIAVAEVVQTRSPDQCQKRWQNALNPELSTADWTLADDDQLKSAVSTYGRNWASISKHVFPNRSPLSLSNRYTSIASQPDMHMDSRQFQSSPTTTTSTVSAGSDHTRLAYDGRGQLSDTSYTSDFTYDDTGFDSYSASQLTSQRFNQADYGQYAKYGSQGGHNTVTTTAGQDGYDYALVDPTQTDASGYYSTSGAWISTAYSGAGDHGSHLSYDHYADPSGNQYSDPPGDTIGERGSGHWS